MEYLIGGMAGAFVGSAVFGGLWWYECQERRRAQRLRKLFDRYRDVKENR